MDPDSSRELKIPCYCYKLNFRNNIDIRNHPLSREHGFIVNTSCSTFQTPAKADNFPFLGISKNIIQEL